MDRRSVLDLKLRSFVLVETLNFRIFSVVLAFGLKLDEHICLFKGSWQSHQVRKYKMIEMVSSVKDGVQSVLGGIDSGLRCPLGVSPGATISEALVAAFEGER